MDPRKNFCFTIDQIEDRVFIHENHFALQNDSCNSQSKYFSTSKYFNLQFVHFFAAACIWEATRLGIILPISLAHTVTNDTQLRGYTIPRDNTCVIANFYAAHR